MHKNLMAEKYGEKIYRTMKNAYKDMYGDSDAVFDLDFVTPVEAESLLSKKEISGGAPSGFDEKANIVPSTLYPNYTFDTFVVGESNKFANAAAHAVASSPGRAYNPLFLYGGVGLGKTHLMHAIGNKILNENPSTNIVYVTSETFTNELINMISRTNNNSNIDMREQFRNKYRKVDVLHDRRIQFIAGKDKTQDEFFHTFKLCTKLNKQIIISSRPPPEGDEQLEERMRPALNGALSQT